ncbi:hypothetical protein SADUNF_Sadunf16G0006100 [Salix dunnii]|uniref:HMA domain-containing protein n=1 Tax=Salix dunnii TaxID=1413687 RepID=A0A835J9P3_9ROSI|nr:hypothetical protein SADUNF_Sadunf16G0006100 [Salix dunnii]
MSVHTLRRARQAVTWTCVIDVNVMFKQKIVLKVQMNCQKCRTKALKVLADADGVSSMGLKREKKENIVVIGEGVDAARLASSFRKKVGHTEIAISVAVSVDKK